MPLDLDSIKARLADALVADPDSEDDVLLTAGERDFLRDATEGEEEGSPGFVAALVSEAERLRSLLKRIEWSDSMSHPALRGDPGDEPVCPVCKRYRCRGHAPDCDLARALTP